MSVEVFHRFDGPEDAPVLVLGNSLGTSIDLWDDQLPALSERFRVLRYDHRGHEDMPDEGYAAGCEALAALDLRERIAAIRAPTLVISGSEDPAAPPDHGRRIVDAIPGARLLIVPAAHLANLEVPDRVTKALLEHLTAEVRA